MNVIYLCDRKECGDRCSYPTCKHTTNVEHAVNFERLVHTSKDEKIVFYTEKEEANTYE